MELWIIATFAAAGVQTLRFMLQKQIKAAGLSTGGATMARFVFAAPLAIATAALLSQILAEPLPPLTALFWLLAFVGGLCQIAGTYCTVALFGVRNFAVGIAFTKTETVQLVAFGLIFLGDAVTGIGVAAILVGFVGVVLISLKAGSGLAGFDRRTVILGVFGGAAFGASAVGYRGAALELGEAHYFFRAAFTLAAVTVMQSAVMGAWLRWSNPGEITKLFRAWRVTALIGLTGMLGSLGWFTAFTLQNAAYVRALGQVELIFGILAASLVFGERVSRREIIGIALLALSVITLVLYL